MPLRLVVEIDARKPAERIDRLVLRHFQDAYPSLSRSSVKEWFTSGRITIAGRKLKASETLPPGAHELTLDIAEEELLSPPVARASEHGCFLPIVYEDDEVLVLDKSSGVPSLPLRREQTETAVGAALARHPSLANLGRGGLEPAILHRLDTGTSGLLVFARTAESFEHLHRAWKSREVRKIYRALVAATEVPSLPMKIDFPLGHDPKSARKMIALRPRQARSIRGKALDASTEIHAGRPFGDALDLEVEIATGVMHQIRCHLAAAGLPIFGDTVYGGAPGQRLWLHAWRLTLPLRSGVELQLESQVPWDARHATRI